MGDKMGDQTRSCRTCQAENAEDAKFCSQCATPLETTQEQEVAALEEAVTHEAGERDHIAESAAKETAIRAAVEQPTGGAPAGQTTVASTSSGAFVSRKTALLIGSGVTVLVAVIAVAAALALGGGSADNKRASAGTTAQLTKTDATQQDTDGDGTPDTEDGAVFDANSTTAPVDDNPTDEFDDAPSSDDEDYLDDADEETEHTSVSVGEPAVDDDVTFKVLSLEAVSSISTGEFSDGPITAKPGAKLVKAVVTWKNNMDDGADIFCGGGSAILLDQNERNFDPIDDQIEISGNEMCGGDVQPGFKQTVTLAFQMPKNSNTTELVLWNSDAEEDYDGEQSDVRVMK
jgi:hypothetical protein